MNELLEPQVTPLCLSISVVLSFVLGLIFRKVCDVGDEVERAAEEIESGD